MDYGTSSYRDSASFAGGARWAAFSALSTTAGGDLMTEAKRERIVVCIEDEQDMIDLTRLVLESHGYRVLGAFGGQEGLDLVRSVKPDVVLLDLMMPGLDGWEVYRRLKEDPYTADIPLVIVTAKAKKREEILEQFPKGVDAYIIKPFGPFELLAALNKILSDEQREGPIIMGAVD
jgi:CheY-like chemotaxis protein